MIYKDLKKTLDSIVEDSKEINFYYKGKKLAIKEFCVTVDGEYKINLVKNKKSFWKGNIK